MLKWVDAYSGITLLFGLYMDNTGGEANPDYREPHSKDPVFVSMQGMNMPVPPPPKVIFLALATESHKPLVLMPATRFASPRRKLIRNLY